MKTLMLAMALLAYCARTDAQTQIRGEVRDKNGKPLPYTTVLLLTSRDSAMVKGGLTTEDGHFLIETSREGHHLVSISMVGYQKVYSKPFLLAKASDVHLSKFELEELPGLLKEVSVTAQKPVFEQQTDRLVVNVSGSISSAGGNALDILERSPGVLVNQQSSTIGLNGKAGVMIMVNGKLSRMTAAEMIQFLSSIPSNSIEKIELITSPPAKYDAEGNAGLINIVLKKSEGEGSNGNLALTGGMGYRPKFNATANLNNRRKKASFYGDLSAFRDYGKWRFALDRTNQLQGKELYLDSKMARLSTRNVFTSRLGAEIFVNSQTTISAQLSGFVNHYDITNERSVNRLYENQLPKTVVDVKRDEANVWRNALGNVSLRHQFNAQSELGLDADWVYYRSVQNGGYDNAFEYTDSVPTRSFERIDSRKDTGIRMLVLKSDYARQFEKVRFEAGLKGTFSKISNAILLQRTTEGTTVTDPDFTSDYRLKDDIAAGYVHFSGSAANKKIKWQAGLRTEYTHTHLYSAQDPAIVLRKYWRLFPSLSGTWQVSKKSQYQLAYSRRITRPEYTQIAPFIAFYGWENFGSGNPKLKAGLTDHLQISHVFDGSYILTFAVSQQRNAITGYQARIDSVKNRFYSNPENIDRIRTYSLMASAPLKITSWWQAQTSVQYAFQQLRTFYENQHFRLDKGYWQVTGQQNFTLPKGFGADVSFNWVSRIWLGVGMNIAYGGVNAGIQKKLSGNHGTLRLTGTDLLRTNGAGLVFHRPDVNLSTQWHLKWDSRVVRLTYTRNFGNSKVKASRKTTGSEEDRKRVSF